MRLDPAVVPAIVGAVRAAFGADAEVWLFGSRADDSARGGDIDLYIETSHDSGLVARRMDLAGRLAALLGDQRIDLVVRPRSRPAGPLHEIARRDGVLLGTAPATREQGP